MDGASIGTSLKWLGVATAAAATGVLYLNRAEQVEEKKKSWREVGKVTDLIINNVKFGFQNYPIKAYCSKAGLKFEKDDKLCNGSFVVYHFQGRNNYVYEDTLVENLDVLYDKIDRHFQLINVQMPEFRSMKFFCISSSFTAVKTHVDEEIIVVRDCGNNVANWLSATLTRNTQKLRLGYYTADYKSIPYMDELYQSYCQRLYSLDKSVVFHSKITSSRLISANTITKISQEMQNPLGINIFKFSPNILIEYDQDGLLEAWKWTELKIGDVEFKYVQLCEHCIYVINKLAWESGDETQIKKFLKILRERLNQPTPSLGIHIEISDTEGMIKVGDPVYALNEE